MPHARRVKAQVFLALPVWKIRRKLEAAAQRSTRVKPCSGNRRAKARKLEQAVPETAEPVGNGMAIGAKARKPTAGGYRKRPAVDPRKARKAAIAALKACKLEQQVVPETAEPVDPRKAAVEAAIARAKVCKLEQQAVRKTGG